MASTFTRTTTYIRLELIKLQIKIALRRTTGVAPDTLDRLLGIGVEKRWIKRFTVYALDRANLCRAQITLDVNWSEFDLQISKGRVRVSIDEKWKDETAIEVDEAVSTFNDFVKEHSLWTKWSVTYTAHVYNNQDLYKSVQQTLGLVAMEPIKWTDKPASAILKIPELNELQVGLYFVE